MSTGAQRPEKICFVGLDNYQMIRPAAGSGYIGGEPVQQTLLAKAFRDIGYQVSMVVFDFGQPDGEVVDGITVWKTFKTDDGIPGLRFFHPRLTSIVAALKRADASVYFQSCAGMITGVVARHCRTYRRTFVFRTASDTDCIPGRQLVPFWRDRKIYEYGLRRADIVSVQGVHQQSLLREHYRVESTPVNMAVELPREAAPSKKNIDVLWVNNFRPLKRADILLELARMLPDLRFAMVGGPYGDGSCFREMEARAKSLPNVEFTGFIPYDAVGEFFTRAKVFVNTSDIEGFPNSFLQAWVRGVPTVSFFDPDNIIRDRGFGFAPRDVGEMKERVLMLLRNEALRTEMGAAARNHALEHHVPAAIAREYEMLLEQSRNGWNPEN